MNVEFALKQGIMEHQSQALFLKRSVQTSTKDHTHSREPSAKPQDTNINLIRSKLVNEISAHLYADKNISQPQLVNQVSSS